MGAFTGKTIVVTGGAGGLGKAIAAAFLAAHGQVVIADSDRLAGETVAGSLGEAASYAPLDVSNETEWERLLDDMEAEGRALDVLVNNAGIYRPNIDFEDMPLAVWREHFAVNADGVFLGCKHGIRRMKGRGGAIVNIGSSMSVIANPTASAYCGSKAAVLMTTRTAAAAGGRYGVRVNAVLPGAVDTPMLMGALRPGDSAAAYLDSLARNGALGRLATADDIARAVLFLADPANGAVSGIHLPVDGGAMR
jgi:NAD(P)-dependent dehydrogenase (short-subunit alcohol dehydrogenase family)